MKLHSLQFLENTLESSDYALAAAAVLPVPYEGGVSYLTGAAKAPDALLKASVEMELYDEALDAEPFRMGIVTVEPPSTLESPDAMFRSVFDLATTLLADGKFPVMVGGDHSVSVPFCKALLQSAGRLSVIQLDAHADLRESYQGSRFSHACTMSRIREMTRDTLQIGIRSFSAEEAAGIRRQNISMCTMEDFRNNRFDVEGAIARLPEPVYLTIDADVFDWSVVHSTGTPEPGGFLWYEALALIHGIFRKKKVIGCDLVELAWNPGDYNSVYAGARLVYKMLGYKLATAVAAGDKWPESPNGPFFT